MVIFLQSLYSRVAKVISEPFVYPRVMRTHGMKLSLRNIMLTPKPIMYYYMLLMKLIFLGLYFAHPHIIFSKFDHPDEGTTQVKKDKVDFLSSQYDNFYMYDGESIDEMLTMFITITNWLVSLIPSPMTKRCENY